MKHLFNIIVVLFSVFSLPLIFLFAELNDILWLKIVVAVLLIPYMLWWGFYGYNFFFGKNKKEDDSLEGDNIEEDRK
jgi:uncharacterized protein YqhQ